MLVNGRTGVVNGDTVAGADHEVVERHAGWPVR
jgi:hypothetical protein